MSARGRLAAALVLAIAAAGCGAPSPDLFAVERSGADRNANLRLVVNDGGTVTCNRRKPVPMEARRLLDARELARDLDELAQLDIELPPGRGSVLRYRVQTPSGSIGFADDSPDRPPALDRLVAFTKTIAEDVCGLRR